MTIRQSDTNLTIKLPNKVSDLDRYKPVFIVNNYSSKAYNVRIIENIFKIMDNYYVKNPRFVMLNHWTYIFVRYPNIKAIMNEFFDISL